ncbi:MAG: ribosome biogenesis GTPase Der [Verrucomicrobiia bacterium]
MSGIIAIVGRPNVGKSALFNRIAGRRIAIVHDEPGVTRDRISAEVEWRGIPFTIVDTGGIGILPGEKTDDQILKETVQQVQIAIESSNLIFFVVDAKDGLTPMDLEIAKHLRATGKTIFVVANKVDNQYEQFNIFDFAKLGFENIFPVSAAHGSGVEQLIKAAIKFLPETVKKESSEKNIEESGNSQTQKITKLCIVGRPNVGKSSIINAITKSARVIVSPVPGTTRDSVDVPFEIETDGIRQKYILIDTAGIRKKRSISTSVEFFSVKRAENSIMRCDIAVLVLDAEAGITEQDKKIADLIIENHKPCIVVINKWDLFVDSVEKAAKEKAKRGKGEKPDPIAEFQKWVKNKLFFLYYAPVIFTSAKTGINLDRLIEAIRYVESQLNQKIPTAILNRVIHDAVDRKQPISDQGHFLKFFYATQIETTPPTFLLFVNRKELFSPQYEKYLATEIRKAFGYEGCPIVLIAKPRPKKELIEKEKRRG